MNILNDLLFWGKKLHHRLGYIQASENLEIFKVKLSWSKPSRLLQRIAFSCSISFTFLLVTFYSKHYQNFIKAKAIITHIWHIISFLLIFVNWLLNRLTKWSSDKVSWLGQNFTLFTLFVRLCFQIVIKNIEWVNYWK